MRLLHTTRFELVEFDDDNVPPYAMLSHLWAGESELTYLEMLDLHEGSTMATNPGFERIRQFCKLADADNIEWGWEDKCCLDSTFDLAKSSETIPLMYGWFEHSKQCYVYLSDVSSSPADLETTFRQSKYFQRKWTLQELVAPSTVEFYASDWTPVGSRSSLYYLISDITGIPSSVLTGKKSPKQCHVSERMHWAANRFATRIEDEAYAIMGLFDVKLTIVYGEGSRAFRRLQEAISEKHYASEQENARSGMRLLYTKVQPPQLRSFTAGQTPEYAILSHTWGPAEEEVVFADICNGTANLKNGYQKVLQSCKLAASQGHEYIWVDTCCIDKSSSAELQEAICSMYKWYKNATLCYVYLEDYLTTSEELNLWGCKWFTRGWTLQELIAPSVVEFYDKTWNKIGTKAQMSDVLADVTGIAPAVLEGGNPLDHTISERMSWASSRMTSRIEDSAYCLMGLFDVFMPMLYGEGVRAFARLQEEILRQTEDYTIFAWKASFLSSTQRGVLARSPEEFIGGKDIIPIPYNEASLARDPPILTSRGIALDLPLYAVKKGEGPAVHLAWIGHVWRWSPDMDPSHRTNYMLVCIAIRESSTQRGTLIRVCPDVIEFVPQSKGHLFHMKRVYLKPFGDVPQSSDDVGHDPYRMVAETVKGLMSPRSTKGYQVIEAPGQYTKTGTTIFLSGTIDAQSASWRDTLSSTLSDLPVTILNPVRKDWDSRWVESMEFPPFAEQVNWELEGMKNADLVAIYFGSHTEAPITLLELGLHAASGKCVVACPKDYRKRGNVQAVCQMHGIPLLEDVTELAEALRRRLNAPR